MQMAFLMQGWQRRWPQRRWHMAGWSEMDGLGVVGVVHLSQEVGADRTQSLLDEGFVNRTNRTRQAGWWSVDDTLTNAMINNCQS